MLAANARKVPRRSNPPCEKKRRSSVEMKASTSVCGTWSSGTISRRSVDSSARSVPSCAQIVVMPGAVEA
jgi:hypothetical protein